MSTPNDHILSDDIYGSRLRLNPNTDERSYATRLFRVRLDPDFVDDGTQTAPYDVVVGPMKRAIWTAVGTNPADYPNLSGLDCQDVTARQVGPHDYEVTAEYYNKQPRVQSFRVSVGTTQIPVFREAFDGGSSAVNATTGLPSGPFIGRQSTDSVPLSPRLITKLWTVPVADVSIGAELNVGTFRGLFLSTGAMPIVGHFNSNSYTVNNLTFGVGELRFDGIDSHTKNSLANVQTYFVNYRFTWRPSGWYSQELTSSGAYASTSDVENSYPRSSFSSSRFPLS